MNVSGNRSRLIEILIGLAATQIIVFAVALYALNEPRRIAAAQGRILDVQLDDAMSLYAENCSVCHGLNGEGIGANPALDSDALRSMPYDELYKTISRGRFATAMPAWALEDGGPLSDYQIGELVALVQSGDWVETGARVVNLGLAPLIPFTTEPDAALLANVASLPDGATLQAGIQVFAANCVACHGADGLGSRIAPALNDTVVREKSADELTRTVTLGTAGTLMAGWGNVLSVDEINAVTALIGRWDEVPSGVIPAPDVSVPTTAESLALGSQLFVQNCARCHGPEGQGTPRAPALNVRLFLTSTTDIAVQQIITLGVPGTAMPAWGDRMTDAEIQAIVGFVRQWEATAPEVAVPVRPGGGGPPWLRSTTQTTAPQGTQGAQPLEQAAPGTGSAGGQVQGQGHGQGQGAAQPTAWWEAVDWRILLLAIGGLSTAFTLILAGYNALKKR